MSRWEGSKGNNKDLGGDIGEIAGHIASLYVPVPGMGELGELAGEQIGGLFGSEGTKYGRYYNPISKSDEDFAEDQNEMHGFWPKLRQNWYDRYSLAGNPGRTPWERKAYRFGDITEDINEQQYKRWHKLANRADEMGMGGLASYAEDREKKHRNGVVTGLCGNPKPKVKPFQWNGFGVG